MIALALLSLARVAWATETDVIGGTDTYNNNGDMLKVVRIDVRDTVAVTGYRFGVYNNGDSNVTPILVLYHLVGDTYELVEQIDGADLPRSGQGWASATPTWLLESGQSYAIGAWMPDGWYYYYDDRTTDPWFGHSGATYRVVSDAVPATFQAEAEQYFYYMEIDSEDADADDDGIASDAWGGADCDDNDPDVGAMSEEIPYDGIDQDCDGSDLTDVDGDGQAAVEAGGPDCDDSDTSIASGAVETCGDGIDQDCDGSDLSCDDTGSGDNGGNGGDNGGNGGDNGGNGGLDSGVGVVDVSPGGCGCASAPSVPAASLLGLVALGLTRRRRG